jgi:hypothetical protein
MKDWFKRFFAVDNSINEHVVMGAIFAAILLVSTFVPVVSDQKHYVLAGAVLAFFGIGALKR